MSNVSYFPDYSQKENVVTNHTLLLIKMLYEFSPLKFGNFMQGLADDIELSANYGLQFDQQRGTGKSVVDGCIEQESIKLIIETKRKGGDFGADQLKRHLNAFGGEKHKILMLLSPQREVIEKLGDVATEAKESGVKVIPVTFADIIDVMRECLPDHDEQMHSIVDDFAGFCSRMGLLPRDEFRMLVPPCGDTFESNKRYDIYYCPAGWHKQKFAYLGMYKDKSVRRIGKVSKIVTCDVDGGELTSPSETLSNDERDRIVNIVKDELAGRAHGLKFHLFEKMVETNFEKISPRGIQGHRYFDLGKVLGEPLGSIDKIGKDLENMLWKSKHEWMNR